MFVWVNKRQYFAIKGGIEFAFEIYTIKWHLI